jgi:hypothetical protein
VEGANQQIASLASVPNSSPEHEQAGIRTHRHRRLGGTTTSSSEEAACSSVRQCDASEPSAAMAERPRTNLASLVLIPGWRRCGIR